jgi:hypothetical protein
MEPGLNAVRKILPPPGIFPPEAETAIFQPTRKPA